MINLIDAISERDRLNLNERNKGKGSFILSFKDEIKTILKEENSLKKQLEKLAEKDERFKNISLMTYSKYLRKYFNKSYSEYLNDNLFERDKFNALTYIVNENIKSSLDLYEKMLDNKLLTYRGSSKVKCNYSFFKEKLKKFITECTELDINDFNFKDNQQLNNFQHIDRKKILKFATIGDYND